MRRVYGRRGWPIGFTMTPMIDIIFQLIIFFLAVNQFQKAETDPSLHLPVASPDHVDPEKDPRSERIILNVRPGQNVHVGGEEFTPERLSEFLRDRQRAAAPEVVEIWIRADRGVPYRQIEPILLACADAGLWKVGFKVLTEDSSQR